jgi:hypothetical protein
MNCSSKKLLNSKEPCTKVLKKKSHWQKALKAHTKKLSIQKSEKLNVS